MFGWFKKKSLPAPEIKPIEAVPLPKPHERIVHVGIIVGHDKKDQGAVMDHPSKLSEYAYHKELANKILAVAEEKFPKLIVSVIFRDEIGIHGAYQKAKEKMCDCVIELHFNATEGHKATGTLTLCTPDANDVEFAHIMHKQLCKAFNRIGDSLGVNVVGKSTRGAPNVYAFPDGVNCLVEPFFGDSEAELGITKQGAYGEAILEGVMLWAIQHDLLSPSASTKLG